ncbi:hypothetical protein [Streptomyces sp. TS71-3]|uniref:hypothetical protein n=1 Tax=Streptomyces sp. TS71-3 TaxID=2733862 RepID=UPI0035AB8AA2
MVHRLHRPLHREGVHRLPRPARRQAGRKVHVIAEGHPVHHSKAVHTWLEENADRIELHLMPG